MRFDEAWDAVVELAASRHGVFHAAEAADRGVTQERLRRAVGRGELLRPHRRVFVLASVPPSSRQRLHVAALATRVPSSDGALSSRAGPSSGAMSSSGAGPSSGVATSGRAVSIGAVSHDSAAAVHGLIDREPERVSLWVPSQVRLRGSGYTIHRAGPIDPASDLTVIDRLPVVNKAASLCQLGTVSPAELDRALDTFARTSSMRWLRQTADRWRRHDPRTVAALDRVMSDPRRHQGPTDSWFERVVTGLLLRRDLPPIETQYEVMIEGRLHRIDIALPDVMLGVEAHSRTFHWGFDVEDADNVRDMLFGSVGWQLLYVTWWQSRHPDEFVDYVVATARTRKAQGIVRV